MFHTPLGWGNLGHNSCEMPWEIEEIPHGRHLKTSFSKKTNTTWTMVFRLKTHDSLVSMFREVLSSSHLSLQLETDRKNEEREIRSKDRLSASVALLQPCLEMIWDPVEFSRENGSSARSSFV